MKPSDSAPEPFLDRESLALLDRGLIRLRGLLRSRASYNRLAAEAEKTIKSVEGKLVRKDWRKTWDWEGFVASGWFDYLRDRTAKKLIPMGKEIGKHLHAVFVALVRLNRDAPTVSFQNERKKELRLDHDKYLSLRDPKYAVPEDEGNEAQRKDEPPFVPKPLQQAILNALEGNALKLDSLARKVNRDKKTVFNALRELRDRELVLHKWGVGYYRPDAPPKAATK